MTAPVFLVDDLAGATPGGETVLDGAEGRHAAVVRRIGPAERLDLADGTGRIAECVVARVEGQTLVLTVAAVREEPEPQPRFVLVQALAKGDRDEQAVESATEVGVDEVVPWQAERSIVQWRGERGERSRRKWEQVARAAAKQSRRARVPVLGPTSTSAQVADRLAAAALALVLHEDADLPLAGLDLPADGDVVLVVGPEGGVAPRELAAFEQAGARAVRLGPTVLRSSSAGPAALAVLSADTRWR